jgi:cyclic pyranopterin phosphate synthase
MAELSHFDASGASRMVDVGEKPVTVRLARASARVRMLPETVRLIRDHNMAKGDVLEVARLAGIQAAKRTWELIPLCHLLRRCGDY